MEITVMLENLMKTIKFSLRTICILSVIILFLVGCKGGGDPIQSSTGSTTITRTQDSGSAPNRFFVGLWTVSISADRETIEILPDRSGMMHFNVTELLEVWPCDICLRITDLELLEDNVVQMDITLEHPVPSDLKHKLPGFDVRGILITGSDYTFPESGRKIAWGDESIRHLNPDGYTTLFNPTEFPETDPSFLGYIEGLYAPGGNLSATLNPFTAYNQNNARRIFYYFDTSTRTVRWYFPEGPVEFGYVIDACWAKPIKDAGPVTERFPDKANCLEAYSIEAFIESDNDLEEGGSADVRVRVLDHQGVETISTVTLEAPDLFPDVISLDLSGIEGEQLALFSGTIGNDLIPPSGEFPLLIRIQDTEDDKNLGAVDAWQVIEVSTKQSYGWARTWGSEYSTSSAWPDNVVVDGQGNVYVVGSYTGMPDLDPGPGVDLPPVYGGTFLCKYDLGGNYVWGRGWGGYFILENDQGLCVDGQGDIYVSGWFKDIADFDPGPGVDYHASIGGRDCFLTKFDSSGDFLWARTWGGIEPDYASEVILDFESNVYVTGRCQGVVDYDPGLPIVAPEQSGCFVSRFNSEGIFEYVLTWEAYAGNDIAVDNLGWFYVTGYFIGEVDFDPGGDVDFHSSNYSGDVFLSKFSLDGMHQWTRTWGGQESDEGRGLTVNSSGDLYITGTFRDIVDFDPAFGNTHTESNGSYDIFVCKYNLYGDFQWVRAWGGESYDYSYCISQADNGNLFVVGEFSETVDFNPDDPDEGTLTSNKLPDAYVNVLNPDGDYLWVRSWGVDGDDSCKGVATDQSGNAYLTGYFNYTVDFDPGEGYDYHDAYPGPDAFFMKLLPNGYW